MKQFRFGLVLGAVLLALAAPACKTVISTPVVTGSNIQTIYLEVWVSNTAKAAGANYDLAYTSAGSTAVLHAKGTLDAWGNAPIVLPTSATSATLTIALAGHQTSTTTLAIIPGQHYPVTLSPPHVTLPPVSASGRVFKVSGATWRLQGATAFTLFKQYLDGEAKQAGSGKATVETFARKAQNRGINTLRVLCRVQWGGLNPKTVPDYDEQLDAFVQTLEDVGLRVELVALADCGSEGHNTISAAYTITVAEQRAFLTRVAAIAAKHSSTFLEWGNEEEYNGWEPDLFASRLPYAVIQSRGSRGMQADPPTPALDYAGYHAGRDSEWPRKMGKQACEYSWGCGGTKPATGVLGVPVIDGEPMRFDASTSATDAYTGFALSSLFVAGAVIHSDALKLATWPTNKTELAAVEAAAQAWKDVPLGTVVGSYVRGPSSSCPLSHLDLAPTEGHPELLWDAMKGSLRTFCAITGSTAVCVVVRPGAAWTATANSGWTITAQKGALKNVVFLKKK
jgi:hypothetical protein